MRIQRNPGSPSAAVALSAMSPSRLRVNRVARRRTLTSGGLLACAGPAAQPSSTLLCLDGQAAACRHRPAKGAGVWLPK
jgi:hypothetical protein